MSALTEGDAGVVAAEAGDSAALWAAFAAPLRGFVARRVPAGVDAEDVVQDVFLRVVRHLPSLRDAERVDAWLFQVARNSLRDALRSRRRRDDRTDSLEVEVPAPPDDQDLHAAQTELAPCLAPLVSRLAEPYRSAIELTSLQGHTQAAAAALAGISVSGMKSRVQRGREQLKLMLLQCCAVQVDARGGVADYHVRAGGDCPGAGNAAPSASRCGSGSCTPRS